MTDYLEGLTPRAVPGTGQLTPAQEILRRYNTKYAEIARSLVDATAAFKEVSEMPGVTFNNDIVLAALGFNFRPDEKQPNITRFAVSARANPGIRFYPPEMEGKLSPILHDFPISLLKQHLWSEI